MKWDSWVSTGLTIAVLVGVVCFMWQATSVSEGPEPIDWVNQLRAIHGDLENAEQALDQGDVTKARRDVTSALDCCRRLEKEFPSQFRQWLAENR